MLETLAGKGPQQLSSLQIWLGLDSRPSSCIKFANKVKKSPVFQPLRMAAGSWLDFTSGEFQRQAKRADMYYRSDGRQ